MKKALIILGAVVLVPSTNLSLVACDNNEKPALTSLTTIIEIVDLGDIAMSKSIPTKEELLEGIQATNPATSTLTTADFDFETTPTATDATITGKGNYTGKVPLTYEKQIIKLETLFIEKKLGAIPIANSIPTKEELLEGIQATNPATSTLTTTDFDFETIPTSTNATITGKGNYTGKVPLTYEKQISDQEIVDAITTIINYQINQQVKTGAYNELKAKILPNFIKSKIKDQQIKDAFNDNYLTILAITQKDGTTKLQDDDLTTAGTSITDAKIIFNYHNLTNKTVNLIINVSSIGDINDQIAQYLKLNRAPNTTTIDQTFYWDNASNSYKWNIGIDSAPTGGKDFAKVDFKNLLTLDHEAKPNAELFLTNILNLSKKDNNTFNPSDLDQFSIEMVPDSYNHGTVTQIKDKGWVAEESIKAQIYIMQNKTIIMDTYNVKTEASQLHINSKGQDIKMQSTDFTDLIYQSGKTAKEFNDSIKLNFATDNTKRLIKLAQEINVINDKTGIRLQITNKEGTILEDKNNLAKNTPYKIKISFKSTVKFETVNSQCQLPLIQ